MCLCARHDDDDDDAGTYWTNFAKNGDPNVGMTPAEITRDPRTAGHYWEPFNYTVQAYMSLQIPGQAMATGLWQEHCDMFDKFDGYQ